MVADPRGSNAVTPDVMRRRPTGRQQATVVVVGRAHEDVQTGHGRGASHRPILVLPPSVRADTRQPARLSLSWQSSRGGRGELSEGKERVSGGTGEVVHTGAHKKKRDRL